MPYVPGPTPLFEDPDLTAYLDLEARRVAQWTERVEQFIIGALPWKAFFVRFEGNADPLLDPIVLDRYNVNTVTKNINTGAYNVILEQENIAGEDITDHVYPGLSWLVDWTAQAPGDATTGIVEITGVPAPDNIRLLASGFQIPASGKPFYDPYNITTGDVVTLFGLLNLGDNTPDTFTTLIDVLRFGEGAALSGG